MAGRYDFFVHLADGDVVVADAGEGLHEVVQFVVMRGEERLGLELAVVDILDDGPGDRDTVVSRGTTAEFVKEDETSLAEVIEDGRSLVHLNHKSGFTQGDIIGRTDTSEYFVHYAY